MTHEPGSTSASKQRDTLRAYPRWKAFIEKSVEQRSCQVERNGNSLQDSRSSDDDGFSLAELWCFHWLRLLLGMRKTFPPPAQVGK